jgi:prepilin-type N-terminal cleavage/methylation domain-containing protein
MIKRRLSINKSKKGFTLIELIVSMAILAIILVITFGTISRYYLVKTFYEQQMNLQQNFLYAMDRLSDDLRQSIEITDPSNNAIIDATKNDPLTFKDNNWTVISYYLDGNGNGTYAIYKKVGNGTPEPVTEEMHQLVRLYFIRYGSDLTAVIVGQVTYFGHTNKISFTSVVYPRNLPQQELQP